MIAVLALADFVLVVGLCVLFRSFGRVYNEGYHAGRADGLKWASGVAKLRRDQILERNRGNDSASSAAMVERSWMALTIAEDVDSGLAAHRARAPRPQ